MKIDVTMNINQVLGTFDRVKRDQVPYALKTALNNTVSKAKAAEEKHIVSVFDRPTKYTQDSVFASSAKKDKLSASVGIKDQASRGGTPASKYLSPEVYGGGRRVKRLERALIYAGVMLPGFYAVVPKNSSWAAGIDTFGNIKAGFIKKVLLALQPAAARMKHTVRGGRSGRKPSGSRHSQNKKIGYFVSYGPTNRNQHLPAGIWAKRGPRGNDVAPVVLFVKDAPTYRPRFRFYQVADQVIRNEFNREFQLAFRHAMATDRGRS